MSTTQCPLQRPVFSLRKSNCSAPFVIARSEATKQSQSSKQEIASLRSQ